MNKTIGVLAAIAIGVAIAWYIYNGNKALNDAVVAPETLAPVTITSSAEDLEIKYRQLIAKATYGCAGEKTVSAEFYKGEELTVEPGQMPVPTGSAKVILSDGRNFDLVQIISADGGRYANSDESFVFWDKGDTALVLENGAEKDYAGCIKRADQ